MDREKNIIEEMIENGWFEKLYGQLLYTYFSILDLDICYMIV